MAKPTAEEKRRSAAAKKGAETRRQRAAEAEAAQAAAATSEGQDSQQTPEQESGLQTPQPDQPIPSTPTPASEPEQAPADTPDESADQSQEPLPTEGVGVPKRVSMAADQRLDSQGLVTLQVRRELELEAARKEHNARTGGGQIQDGEVLIAQHEHYKRTDPAAGEAFVKQLMTVGDPAEE
jgi:hypothetical protein